VLTPRTLEAISAIPRHPSSHAVFVRPATGDLLSEQTLRAWFGKARELAGIDAYAAPGEGRIRPHDLRSGGATTADERGARATAIRDTLGHASTKMTERYLRSGALDNARHVAGVMSEAPRIGPRRAAPQSTRGAKNLATTR
jgi:integrase